MLLVYDFMLFFGDIAFTSLVNVKNKNTLEIVGRQKVAKVIHDDKYDATQARKKVDWISRYDTGNYYMTHIYLRLIQEKQHNHFCTKTKQKSRKKLEYINLSQYTSIHYLFFYPVRKNDSQSLLDLWDFKHYTHVIYIFVDCELFLSHHIFWCFPQTLLICEWSFNHIQTHKTWCLLHTKV